MPTVGPQTSTIVSIVYDTDSGGFGGPADMTGPAIGNLSYRQDSADDLNLTVAIEFGQPNTVYQVFWSAVQPQCQRLKAERLSSGSRIWLRCVIIPGRRLVVQVSCGNGEAPGRRGILDVSLPSRSLTCLLTLSCRVPCPFPRG
jgi:hypothetical protein